jgi:hypothetical protein
VPAAALLGGAHQQQQQQQAAAFTSSPTRRFCLQPLLPPPLLLLLLQSLVHSALQAQVQLRAATTRLMPQLLLLLNLRQVAQWVKAPPADTQMPLLKLLQQQHWMLMQQLIGVALSQLAMRIQMKKMMMVTSCVWCAGSSSAAWLWCMAATHTW